MGIVVFVMVETIQSAPLAVIFILVENIVLGLLCSGFMMLESIVEKVLSALNLKIFLLRCWSLVVVVSNGLKIDVRFLRWRCVWVWF